MEWSMTTSRINTNYFNLASHRTNYSLFDPTKYMSNTEREKHDYELLKIRKERSIAKREREAHMGENFDYLSYIKHIHECMAIPYDLQHDEGLHIDSITIKLQVYLVNPMLFKLFNSGSITTRFDENFCYITLHRNILPLSLRFGDCLLTILKVFDEMGLFYFDLSRKIKAAGSSMDNSDLKSLILRYFQLSGYALSYEIVGFKPEDFLKVDLLNKIIDSYPIYYSYEQNMINLENHYKRGCNNLTPFLTIYNKRYKYLLDTDVTKIQFTLNESHLEKSNPSARLLSFTNKTVNGIGINSKEIIALLIFQTCNRKNIFGYNFPSIIQKNSKYTSLCRIVDLAFGLI